MSLKRSSIIRTIAKVLSGQSLERYDIVIPILFYPWYPLTFVNEELLFLKKRGFNIRILVYNLRGYEELHEEYRDLLPCIEPVATKDIDEHKKNYIFFCDKYPDRMELINGRLQPYLGNKSIDKEPYLLPAFTLARQLLGRRVGFIYSHFTYQASTWAYIMSHLLNVPYGFQTHADSFVDSPYKLLREQVSDAVFTFAISHQARNNVLSLCGQEFADKVIIKRNGIDVKKFNNPFLPSEHRLISISRLAPKKGLIYLVEACNILLKRGFKFTCDIIGSAGNGKQKEVEETLNRAIQSYGIGDSIIMHGYMTRDKIIEYLGRSTLFIAPYIITDDGERDGIPTTMLEAMAMSVVPVTTDSGAISELVTNGSNGIIVAQKDPVALAKAIECLITDREYFLRLRGQARGIIEAEYDRDVVNMTLEERIRKYMM